MLFLPSELFSQEMKPMMAATHFRRDEKMVYEKKGAELI
jgi:hypothetical protein